MVKNNKSKNTILQFLRQTGFIKILSELGFIPINHQIKSKYYGFRRLNNGSIEGVLIYKFDAQFDNSHKEPLVLSARKTDRLARKWNNSCPVGICKYIPDYIMIVKMDDGIQRNYKRR